MAYRWNKVPVIKRVGHFKSGYRMVKINKLSNFLLLDYLEFPVRDFGNLEKYPNIYHQLKKLAVHRKLMPAEILTD